MTTFVSNLFAINGVISTDKSVMDNLNTMCSAAGAYLTYDISEGKWSVIINRPGTSVASFDDSNILGGINISGTGVSELYNAVTIEFPHKDLRDQTDYIDFEIDSADRFPNELDNRLNISIECVNDPIQAGYIAASELKQSRVDKIIEFRTDYTNLGLKAGDLIDVTNSVYAYTNKMFRIIKVEEADEEGLVISISALEYDANVYSTAGLIRKVREKKTGIVPKSANQAITASDNLASLKLDVTPSAQAQGISLFYVTAAAAAANAALSANTWYVDYAGKQVNITASDVVITWLYFDGVDLDIRCRLVQPFVGQYTIGDFLGYTYNETDFWPLGTGPGTAFLEWGGDNQGPGGDPTASETVRIDIDRIKQVYPNKRYIAVECRGNWYNARGAKPVQLLAKLYEGGTTTKSGFNFVNVGAVRSRELDSQGVYVDSFYGETIVDGINGTNALGDLMGYFLYDTVNKIGQFVQTLPPAASQ